MSAPQVPEAASSLRHSAVTFIRGFVEFSGRKIVWAGLLMAVGAVLESIGIVLLIPLLSVVLTPAVGGDALHHHVQDALAHTGIHSHLGQLALLFSIFIALMILRGLVMLWRDVRITQLRVYFLEAQREQLMRSLASASWDRVLGLRHARVVHAMGGEIGNVAMATAVALQCTISVVLLIAQVILAWVLSPALTGLAIVLLAIGIFGITRTLARAHSLGAIFSTASLRLMDTTTQFLGGLKLAVSQNLQSRFVDEAHQTLHAMAQRQIEYVLEQSRSRLILNIAPAFAAAAIILIGVGLLDTQPAVLVAFLVILARTAGPLTQIQQGLQQLANSLPAFDKIKQLEAELRSDAPHSANANVPASAQEPVTFRAVSYRHTDEGGEHHAGVQDVSLTIAPRAFVGITGQSGSGKTTFADLLVGLIEPDGGEILLGARALKAEALDGFRAGLSYVSQDPFLFHDTIRRNLTWVRPDASDVEMWDALALAGADAIIRRDLLGLDAELGERGSTVSGGERQRIALARAILRKPKFLILDEAMNALDQTAERQILDRLLALEPRMTIVMITHRPESLARCDMVLEFESGRVTVRKS